MSPIAAWTLFALLGGLFVFIAGNNAVLAWRRIVCKREKTPSMIPFLGGILGYAGGRLAPVEALADRAWLALILDVGSGPYLVFGLCIVLPELWRTSRFNLVRAYVGQKGIKTVWLRLFRRGIFTIEQRFERPREQTGLTACSTTGRWHRDGERLVLEDDGGGDPAVFKIVAGRPTETLRQAAGFAMWENAGEAALADIDLILTNKRGV